LATFFSAAAGAGAATGASTTGAEAGVEVFFTAFLGAAAVFIVLGVEAFILSIFLTCAFRYGSPTRPIFLEFRPISVNFFRLSSFFY
jgi:hypothetical protein